MRYFRIEFLDDAATPGFMEVDDNGNFVRLVDVGGKTFADMPHTSYRTLDDHEAETPVWGEASTSRIFTGE